MAESTLSVNYSDLLVEVGVFLGYKADTADWSDSERAEVDRYIQAGVKQFYYPPAAQGVEAGYSWSFLSPSAELDVVVDVGSYDLPDNLGRVLGDFFFDNQEHRPSIIQISDHRIKACAQRSDNTGVPCYVNVRHKEQEAGSGQRMEALFYPVPDGDYKLYYRYEAFSGKLSEANPYPLGGMRHSELVTESCLAVAEQRANDETGQHTAAFMRMLPSAVAFDRRQGAKCYGRMGQPQEVSVDYNRANGYVTYKGDTW